MATLFRPTYTDKATGRKRRLKKWYARLADRSGRVRKVPLSADKAAATAMLADLIRRAERHKAGLIDRDAADHRATPLADHFAAWADALPAHGAGEKHVADLLRCGRRVIDGTGALFIPDLSADRVRAFLASLRRDKPAPALDPGKGHYTRGELAALLGVGKANVTSLVARHRLAGEGNGKARRYPAETARVLLAANVRGMSAASANDHLAAARQFCRWLRSTGRNDGDPLADVEPFDVEADRRRERRVLSADEIRRVLSAARESRRTFRDLTGPDRTMVYALAGVSGFRAEELAAVTPRHLDLDAPTPFVALSAAESKNGKAVEQPLPPDVVAALRAYVAGKSDRTPLWPGTWHGRAADMLRIDLEAAGVPFAVDGRTGPLVADLHAFRGSFIVMLERAGATLREAMTLARHSDPKLTMKTYGRLRLTDLGAAVARLPALLEAPAAPPVRSTGTAGADAPDMASGIPKTCPNQ